MPKITSDGLIPDEEPNVTTVPEGQWAIASGSPDIIQCSYDETVLSLTDGMLLTFRATGDNVSTTPTFSPDTLEAHTIVKASGALVPDDILEDGEYMVRYNDNNHTWMLLNPTQGA